MHRIALPIVFIFAYFLGDIVKGFPDGAPADTCFKPIPNQPYHGQHKSQELETNPYQVVQSSEDYGPGSQIAVTIQGKENFKGFFIQARDVETNEWIGEWVDTANAKIHHECSAITHSDPKEKIQASLVWKAPAHLKPGKVYFTGTVLKEYNIFWTKITSSIAQNSIAYNPFI